MEYPGTIQFETTSACNAHCEFCPRSSKSPQGRMSPLFFRSLLEQIAKWPVKPEQICPFVTNEPFADPRIFEYCSWVNELLPNAYLTFFTNASMLDHRRRDALRGLKNVRHVFCSLHHANEADYRRDLGLDFDRTVENISALEKFPNDFKLHVLRVASIDHKGDAEFLAWSREKFPSADSFVARRINYKGDTKISEPEMYQDIICPRHSSMIILYTGVVALCCQDHLGKYPLGDARREKLLDIFNSQTRLKFSTQTKKCNEPCNRCNMAF